MVPVPSTCDSSNAAAAVLSPSKSPAATPPPLALEREFEELDELDAEVDGLVAGAAFSDEDGKAFYKHFLEVGERFFFV